MIDCIIELPSTLLYFPFPLTIPILLYSTLYSLTSVLDFLGFLGNTPDYDHFLHLRIP